MISNEVKTKNVYIFVHDIKQHAGTELAAIKLSEVLSDKNINAKIISLADFANGEYLNISKIQRWRKDYSLIRKMMLESKGACIIGTTHAINILIALAAFRRRVKTILCEHLPYFSKSTIQKITARIIYKFADATVFLTRRDANCYRLNNAHVVPNYIEFNNYNKKNIDGGGVVNFLIAGRLCYQKGTDLLLEIIDEFEFKKLNYKLKICGVGPMLQVVEELLSKNPRIEYLGHVEHAQSLMELSRADVLLLPSRFEGFPFVMLESLSLGTPVVAFDCPTGPSEIISKDSGRLVQYLNTKEFSHTAMEFAQEVKEKTLIYETNCKSRASKFSKENFEQQWIELLGAV